MAAEFRPMKRSASDDEWGIDFSFDTPKKQKEQENEAVSHENSNKLQDSHANGLSPQNGVEAENPENLCWKQTCSSSDKTAETKKLPLDVDKEEKGQIENNHKNIFIENVQSDLKISQSEKTAMPIDSDDNENEILQRCSKISSVETTAELPPSADIEEEKSKSRNFMKDAPSSTSISGIPVGKDALLISSGSDEVETRQSEIVHRNFTEDIPCLSKISSVEKDALLIASVVEDTDVSEAYEKLIEHRMHPQRVDIVTNDLLENSKTVEQSSVSANEILQLADSSSKSRLEKEDSLPDDPAFRNDPIFRDMHLIRKILPNEDPNEIYAFLEAHHDNANRVLTVIQLLTKVDYTDSSRNPELSAGQSSSSQSELDQLKDIYPDCDPNFLYEKLEEYAKYPDRMQKITTELFANPVYPSLKETLDREKKQAQRRKFEKLYFDMHEYLLKFPDPSKTFYDETKLMSQCYRDHCAVYLAKSFPHLKLDYFRQVLENHNYHLTPTVREIEISVPDIKSSDKMKNKQHHKNKQNYPDEVDEVFCHELLFINNEKKITDFLEEKRQIHEARVEEARVNNELYECPCCFNDDCLFEEMCSCPDGHLFCNECVKRMTETAIGEGKTKFPCLTGTCQHDFQLSLLQKILSPNIFSIALRKRQEEELREAGIPDLESCPFCSFATVMSNKDDKVFKCLNPECLKQSCRLCREPSHIPLRCDEVEREPETKMRAYIELKMSEAMFRKCPQCGKRFFKEEGCNSVTCPCGVTVCYVCGQPFERHTRQGCNNIGLEVHQQEMEAAAEKAKNEYLMEHPELRDIVLKYDPLKHVQAMKQRHGRVTDLKNTSIHDYDSYNSAYDGSNSDSDSNFDYY